MARPGGIGRHSRAITASVWAITVVTVVLLGVVVWSEYQLGLTDASDIFIGLAYLITLLAFILSGVVIASRQPGNVIAWLLIIPGFSAALSEVLNNWLHRMDPVAVTANPGIWLALWYVTWSWVLLIYPVFHLLLVFPGGRLLSARWRWVVGVEVAMVAFMVGSVTFAGQLALVDDNDQVVWSLDNPIGFIPESFFQEAFGLVWTIGLLFLTVAGLAAFILRYRSGSLLERQQLKWPLYAMAVWGIAYGITAASGGQGAGTVWDALFGISLAGIPIAVAIAVLRFRLYELDRLVSRTVTYAAIAVSLIATYGLIVLGLGSFLGRESPVAVAGATLGAAAVFTPLRARIRGRVDRRFNRSRYDAEQVIEAFVASMSGRVDPESVIEGWVGVVSETMQPVSAGAWVRS